MLDPGIFSELGQKHHKYKILKRILKRKTWKDPKTDKEALEFKVSIKVCLKVFENLTFISLPSSSSWHFWPTCDPNSSIYRKNRQFFKK